MPLLRAYDPGRGKVVVTLKDAYLDRLARWSDIQEYLPFLHEQARSRPGVRVLELGTRKGNSTLAFLAGAVESGGHVWSCDIDDVRRDPDGIGPFGAVAPVDVHPRRRHGPGRAGALPAEVDVLFIDTSHEYEHTLAECRAYVPRVAPGGIALFHDTHVIGWPGYEWDRDIPPCRRRWTSTARRRGCHGRTCRASTAGRDPAVTWRADENRRVPYEPVRVLEVVSRDRNGTPDGFREYRLNPTLLALLEGGELDWDNPAHREAYLRAWVKRAPGGRKRNHVDR